MVIDDSHDKTQGQHIDDKEPMGPVPDMDHSKHNACHHQPKMELKDPPEQQFFTHRNNERQNHDFEEATICEYPLVHPTIIIIARRKQFHRNQIRCHNQDSEGSSNPEDIHVKIELFQPLIKIADQHIAETDGNGCEEALSEHEMECHLFFG